MKRLAVCRLCGGRLEYRRRRFAWVHVRTGYGIAHPPLPAEEPELEERSERVGEGEGL